MSPDRSARWSPTSAIAAGSVFDDNTDWTEIGELVEDSFRAIAPRKVSRLLNTGPLEN